MADPREEVLIDYTNWRGERRWRRIRPIRVAFENSEWHHESQWILHAVEVDMAANREFAMKDIHEWKPTRDAVGSSSVPSSDREAVAAEQEERRRSFGPFPWDDGK